MKNRVLIVFASVAAMAATLPATAQDGPEFGGFLMNRNRFDITDMLQMSQYNGGFTTARASAMGGAFTSLGADLTSVSLNPAGLGMYRSSDVSITPNIMIGKSNVSHDVFSKDADRSRFIMNNGGAAFNLYQGTGRLTSFTLGVSFNRLADFNYELRSDVSGTNTTLVDVFYNQLQGVLLYDILERNNVWNNNDVYIEEWGAALAYRNGLITRAGSGDDYDYNLNSIDINSLIDHRFKTVSSGYIGEYNVSGGFNIDNVLYLGLGIGIQDIYKKERVYYDEYYSNNAGTATQMLYDQTTITSGVGVNLKFGMIVRPTDGLRIGLAVHTPTWASVDKEYYASLASNYRNGNFEGTNIYTYDYDFNTPTRLMAGISYTIGNMAVLTADYERTWYNGMRLTNVDDWIKDIYKERVKYDFKAANTFRFGAEVRPIPELALRAGFAYQDSPLRSDFNHTTDRFNVPIQYRSVNYSAGLGYRFDQFYMDFAYVFMKNKYTRFDMYSYPDDPSDPYVNFGNFSTSLDKHNIIVSLGYRF